MSHASSTSSVPTTQGSSPVPDESSQTETAVAASPSKPTSPTASLDDRMTAAVLSEGTPLFIEANEQNTTSETMRDSREADSSAFSPPELPPFLKATDREGSDEGNAREDTKETDFSALPSLTASLQQDPIKSARDLDAADAELATNSGCPVKSEEVVEAVTVPTTMEDVRCPPLTASELPQTLQSTTSLLSSSVAGAVVAESELPADVSHASSQAVPSRHAKENGSSKTSSKSGTATSSSSSTSSAHSGSASVDSEKQPDAASAVISGLLTASEGDDHASGAEGMKAAQVGPSSRVTEPIGDGALLIAASTSDSRGHSQVLDSPSSETEEQESGSLATVAAVEKAAESVPTNEQRGNDSLDTHQPTPSPSSSTFDRTNTAVQESTSKVAIPPPELSSTEEASPVVTTACQLEDGSPAAGPEESRSENLDASSHSSAAADAVRAAPAPRKRRRAPLAGPPRPQVMKPQEHALEEKEEEEEVHAKTRWKAEPHEETTVQPPLESQRQQAGGAPVDSDQEAEKRSTHAEEHKQSSESTLQAVETVPSSTEMKGDEEGATVENEGTSNGEKNASTQHDNKPALATPAQENAFSSTNTVASQNNDDGHLPSSSKDEKSTAPSREHHSQLQQPHATTEADAEINDVRDTATPPSTRSQPTTTIAVVAAATSAPHDEPAHTPEEGTTSPTDSIARKRAPSTAATTTTPARRSEPPAKQSRQETTAAVSAKVSGSPSPTPSATSANPNPSTPSNTRPVLNIAGVNVQALLAESSDPPPVYTRRQRRTRRKAVVAEDHALFAEHRDLCQHDQTHRIIARAPFATDGDVLNSLTEWRDSLSLVYARLLWRYTPEPFLHAAMYGLEESVVVKPESRADGDEVVVKKEKEDE